MKKLFIGVYNPSIILTYIGVFCSLYGMSKILIPRDGTIFDVLTLGMIMLVIAGVCDMFDGRIARLCKRTEKEKEFGIQLDSLADTASFVVFPATLLIYATHGSIAGIVVAMFYCFAGIMRLGWFNVTTEENKGYFFGLPVTFSAIIIPSTYLIMHWLSCGKYQNYEIVFPIVYGITGLLFISNFKLKKPGLVISIALVLLSIAAITFLILT
jgi:CDP-diacylglycerol--serine O-phosphatidyltransferase